MEQLQTEIGLLLKGKSIFSSKTTKKLGDLVDKYPYAPIFHFLYLRGLQEEDSYKFPSQLNRSSVSTNRRKTLTDVPKSTHSHHKVGDEEKKKKKKKSSTKRSSRHGSSSSSHDELPFDWVCTPTIPQIRKVPVNLPRRPSIC